MDVLIGYEGTPKLEIYREDEVWVVGGDFEAYSAPRKALYKIAGTLISPETWRFAIPSTLPIGFYSGVIRDDSTDAFVAGKPITVRAETSAVVPESGLITELRKLAKDAPDSNFIQEETPKAPGGGAPNGTNKIFRLQRQYVVPGTVYVTQGSSFRSGTGFSLDAVNGVLTFDTAPTSGVDPFCVDYNFYWFPDTYYTEFLVNAAQAVNYTDPDDVPAVLKPALLQFALYHYYVARASEYAHKFGASGGNASQQVDTVTGNFMKLAKAAWSQGVTLRDDYYKGRGKRNVPSSGSVAYKIDPYTPRR